MPLELKFPTEIIDLPSKGLLYPENHPLSSGKVELKYMTAASEDILTTLSYIQEGVVLDKLLESLLIDSSIKVNELYSGDKNALLVAARVLGYGKDYKFMRNGVEHVVDLSKLENKPIDETLFIKGKNEFEFTLPNSKYNIKFKLLNGSDQKKIDQELDGLKKLNPKVLPEITTRLKHIITSVDGETDTKTIREFVDKYLSAIDSRELRNYIKKIQPDVDLTVKLENGEEAILPIGTGFFWPDL
jgi:hypothetical protein